MKKITLLSLILISMSSVFAASEKMTPKDIMAKIDSGRINWDIEPAFKTLAIAYLMKIGKLKDPRDIPENLIKGLEPVLIKDAQNQYIYFQPEMANVRYIQDRSWRYYITFDFATSRKCTFRVEKIDNACGNPVCSMSVEDPSKHPNVDLVGTPIPDSYCEKIYGIKITQQGNLQKDSIGVPNEKK